MEKLIVESSYKYPKIVFDPENNIFEISGHSVPENAKITYEPILKWISDNLGPWTRVNLMFQYRPEWMAHKRPKLGRRLTREEMNDGKKIAKDVGLKNLVH